MNVYYPIPWYIEAQFLIMKKVIVFFVGAFLIGLLFSCTTPKSYYKTREGKKKQDYYNKLQYGQKM